MSCHEFCSLAANSGDAWSRGDVENGMRYNDYCTVPPTCEYPCTVARPVISRPSEDTIEGTREVDYTSIGGALVGHEPNQAGTVRTAKRL